MMTDQEFIADLIEVIETGAFKSEHLFQYGGGVLGFLSLKTGRTEGVFKAESGEQYHFKKTSPWKSHYEWRDNTSLVASAMPKGKLNKAFIVEYQGNVYGLLPGGSKLRSWKIKTTSTQDICEYKPRGPFKRGAMIRIGAEIPLGLLVFCYCLVSKRWQEQYS
jgi:hypothetical protein